MLVMQIPPEGASVSSRGGDHIRVTKHDGRTENDWEVKIHFVSHEDAQAQVGRQLRAAP